jgi:DNA-binding transcriptional regulator GbsR (MarR family)
MTAATALDPVEEEFVAYFVRLASALGLPRSVGEIFGLLFAAPDPVPFDEVVSRLGISKGSASQGLKFLAQVGAIAPVYVPRDRRTFYEAETRMRKLFGNALRESVKPHLEGNRSQLARIEERLSEAEAEDGIDGRAAHYRTRLGSLRGWNDKALQLLPLLERVFSLPAPLFPFFPKGLYGTADEPADQETFPEPRPGS